MKIQFPMNEVLLKVLCYLQCEKICVVFLQNEYMFAKNYHLNWIVPRANILSKYIIHIFFNFGRAFCGSSTMLFPNAPTSCCKKILNNFCCIVLLYLWAQKACLRFLKSHFKLEMLIFLPFVVSLLGNMFN